jgi:orotidine-5'-phosphate decarboxylase
MTVEPFGRRLHRLMADRGPLCVGIDPHAALLSAWDLPDDARGLERFSRTVVEALGERVAVFKPQSAFFERHGAAGITVLERVIADVRAAGALVLLDVKRGDIGSTMQAYADAYLDPSRPLAVDAITVSPYLGFGSLSPAIETAMRWGAGVLVLALTSNPEGVEVQHARTEGGQTVAGQIIERVGTLNRDAIASGEPMGSIGLVVGATIGHTGHDFSDVNGPILAPGVGAQGGTVKGLAAVFGSAVGHVLPSVSREILGAGPSADSLRDAADRHLAASVALTPR